MIINPYAFSSGASGDPQWANVILLNNFEGANAATTFFDDVGGQPWSFANGAALSTAQKKFGSSSAFFNAGNSLISAPIPAIGTGDFTFEGMLYITATNANGATLFDTRPAGTNGFYPDVYLVNGIPRLYVNGADRITAGSALSTGVWHHVALCRASGVTRLFVDGVQAGSNYTDTNNYATSRLQIGANGFSPSAGDFALGYVDAVRITIGYARYTTTFTPPASVYPEGATARDPFFSKVSALLHMDGADSSTTITDVKGHTFTAHNTVALKTASAFFGSAGVLFDTTNTSNIDCAASTDFALGSGDFTIEMMLKKTTTTTQTNFFEICTTQGANPTDRLVIYFPNSSLNPSVYSNGNLIGSTRALTANTYAHLALVRYNNVLSLYINGQGGGAVSNTTNFTQQVMRLGSDIGAGLFALGGSMDEVRITKGTARYFNTFTPPTAAFADAA